MPVLKATQHTSFPRDAIVLDLSDLSRQAAKLRMAAETKAARILTDAERQAATLVEGAEARGYEAGRSEGFARGLEEGREQGRQDALAAASSQLGALQQAWVDVARQLDAQRRDLDREARQMVLEFALKVAEKLVHRTIEVDPTVVVDQVVAALSQVLRPLGVVVRVHPDDKPLLEEAMPELMAEFGRFEHVQMVDDMEVARGGCVVTYGEGEVDATIDTQIRRVIDLILPDGRTTEPAPAAAAEGVQDEGLVVDEMHLPEEPA